MLLMITEEVGGVAFRIQTTFWPAWVLLVCWPCIRSSATGHIGSTSKDTSPFQPHQTTSTRLTMIQYLTSTGSAYKS